MTLYHKLISSSLYSILCEVLKHCEWFAGNEYNGRSERDEEFGRYATYCPGNAEDSAGDGETETVGKLMDDNVDS
jgi:hypothetical protein